MKLLKIIVYSSSSNYRELHFPSEYIIQKQLEEKSPSLDRNRIRVDHYYRPLKLQYQTIRSVLSYSSHHHPLFISQYFYSKSSNSIFYLYERLFTG